MKSAPRFHCGDSMNACTTSAMNAWPVRTSPCGCSSPDTPGPSPMLPPKFGSTYETLGSVPVAQRS